MSTLVKICGITSLNDALHAVECGADLLGFNFYSESSRYIDPDQAKEIIKEIPPAISRVGVFVNADPQTVIDIAVDLELDHIQFHGDETPSFCNVIGHPWFKAFRLKDESIFKEIPKYQSEWVMVDAYVEKAFGGTGVMANWDLAVKAKEFGQLILSGGLKPENVEQAIRIVKPYAVDVASGVESSPGVKDPQKVEEFIRKVKNTR